MRAIDCPSEEGLKAYLERERGSDPTAGIETHLVGCRACRLDLLNLQAESIGAFELVPVPPKLKERVAKSEKPRASFFQNLTGWTNAPAFAAAALVLIAITAAGLWRFTNPVAHVNTNSEVLRSDGRPVSSVRAVFPVENVVVSGPTIEFRWRTEAKASRYTVEVLDEDGDIIYQGETAADHIMVDTLQAQLHPQRKYFWYVKAKLADGTENETNPIPFSIRSK